jgi:hypothetical protein
LNNANEREKEIGVYIEFVKWLLHLSDELLCLGDFIINLNRKCRMKNKRIGVFEAGWSVRINHGLDSGILRAMRSYI